jgi:hypothetical protein
MDAIDYLNDDTDDLIIDPVRGDFASGPSDEQHIRDYLLSNPGEYRQWPLVGVGITQRVNAPWSTSVRQRLDRTIRVQLTADGLSVTRVDLSDPANITVTADRT